MTIKATILYSKIAQQLGIAPEDDCRRINNLQDSLIAQGRWSPIGQLFVENKVLTAEQHTEVMHHHKITNRTENDKIVSDFLTKHGLIEEARAQKILQQALERAAVERTEEEWPRSAFAAQKWSDEETGRTIQDLIETIYDPLTRMTGYCEVLVEDRGDLTQGRLAFQLNYVSRAQLFAALHNQSSLDMYKPIRKVLFELGLTNEAEDGSIKDTIDLFLPA